jgi:hypothetical protein
MTLYALYAKTSPSLSESLPTYCVTLLPSAGDRVGFEEGVARDYSARRSRCGPFLS